MTNNEYILPKGERLCANKRIDALFVSGQSFIAYPLRVVYIRREKDLNPVTMMVNVSKRKFKRAVKRNRVKRLIREAYRLNKAPFIELANACNQSFDIAFLYLKNELPDYDEIEKAVIKTGILLQEREERKEV